MLYIYWGNDTEFLINDATIASTGADLTGGTGTGSILDEDGNALSPAMTLTVTNPSTNNYVAKLTEANALLLTVGSTVLVDVRITGGTGQTARFQAEAYVRRRI